MSRLSANGTIPPASVADTPDMSDDPAQRDDLHDGDDGAERSAGDPQGEPAAHDAPAEAGEERAGLLAGLGIVGFFGIFVVGWTALTVTVTSLVVSSALNQLRAEDFPTVTGRILESRVETHRDSEGDLTYHAELRYVYEVDGTRHESDRYRYGLLGMSTRGHAQRIVDRHPPDSEVEVFYDPNDPAEALLHPGIEGQDLVLGLFLTPFNVVMLIMLYVVGTVALHRVRPPVAAGVRLQETGRRTRFRIVSMPPILSGLLAIAGVTFASIFPVLFTAGFDPPIHVVAIIWGVALGIGLAVWARGTVAIAFGEKDLVIDHDAGTLRLPKTFGRKRFVEVPLADVAGIRLTTRVMKNNEGASTRKHRAVVAYVDDNGETQEAAIRESTSRGKVRDFVTALRERLAPA